jgi:uncharacterized membrane protein YozB (DUF420 family)
MFPDSRPLMLSDLSLLIQIIVFILILYAYYITRESLVKHGKIAEIAFYVALPSIFYMIYSRIRAKGLELPDYHSIFGIHIMFGILSILLVIIFVANRWKWKRKRYMDLGILLWTVTFLLGIAIYMRINHFL